MRFDKKNPKFLVDLVTMILAVIIIVLTIAVIIGAPIAILSLVFYFGAAMFAANIVRGFISRKYTSALLIIPVIVCITAGLAAQGVMRPWIF